VVTGADASSFGIIPISLGFSWVGERRLVITGKGGMGETAVLNTRVARLLRQHLEGSDDGPVFRSRRGGRLSVRQIQYRLRGWLGRACVENRVTVHGLRHTFGTRLYAHSRDLRLVQQALHHRRVTTTEIYAHLADDRLAEVVEAM
jgi:integrase/recombinase XerC